MSPSVIERDERTLAVENAGYKWSYLTLSFGLLGIVAYRSLIRGEAAWDLLVLVVLAGGVNTIYQASRRVLFPRWIRIVVLNAVIAALMAAAIILFRRHF